MKISNLIEFLLLITFPFCLFANDWHEIELKGFQKEIISDSQIRFKSNDVKNLIIHMQVDKYDKLWSQDTLKKDLEEMFKSRKKMYDIFGFSDVEFNQFNLSEIAKHQCLNIYGSYKKPNDKKLYFLENNIYYDKRFLQIKVLREDKQITQNEIDLILKNIAFDKVEL